MFYWQKTALSQVDNLLFFSTDCNFSLKDPRLKEATKALEYHGAAASLDPANLFTIDKSSQSQQGVGSAIYHTNPRLRSIVTAAGRAQTTKKLRLASLGSRLMTLDRRRGAATRYRLSQAGLRHVVDQLSERRRVLLPIGDMRLLLVQHPLPLDQVSEPVRAALAAMDYGQCLVSCQLSASCTVSMVAFVTRERLELIANKHVIKYHRFLLEVDSDRSFSLIGGTETEVDFSAAS